MSVRENKKKNFNFSSLKLDLNLLNSKPGSHTLNIGSQTQRNGAEGRTLPDINSKKASEKLLKFPTSAKSQKKSVNEPLQLDLAHLTQRLLNFDFFLRQNFESLDERALGHIDYDTLGKLAYDPRIFPSVSLTDRDATRSMLGDNDTTLTSRKDNSYRQLCFNSSDSNRTIKINRQGTNSSTEGNKKMFRNSVNLEPGVLKNESNLPNLQDKKNPLARSTSLSNYNGMYTIPEQAPEKGASKVSKKLYLNIQKAEEAFETVGTPKASDYIKKPKEEGQEGEAEDIYKDSPITLTKTMSVDKGQGSGKDVDHFEAPFSPIIANKIEEKSPSKTSLEKEAVNNLMPTSTGSIESPKSPKVTSTKVDKVPDFIPENSPDIKEEKISNKQNDNNNFSHVTPIDNPEELKGKDIDNGQKINADNIEAEKNKEGKEVDNREPLPERNIIRQKSKSENDLDKLHSETRRKGAKTLSHIKASSIQNTGESPKSKTTETTDQIPSEPSIMDPEHKRLLSKFNFTKKPVSQRIRKNSSSKSMEFDGIHVNDEEFIRAFDHVIKNIQKTANSNNPVNKTVELENSKHAIKKFDTNQISLEDLLKQEMEESKIRSMTLDEPSSAKKVKQKQESIIFKTFSFKDQTITININPPIEEVAAQLEDVSENVGTLQRIDSETPPPETQRNNSESGLAVSPQRRVYKFDLNRNKTVEDIEDALSDDITLAPPVVDKSYKRRGEDLFNFDEIYDNGIENLTTKSNKLRCKANFLLFAENIILYPYDVKKHTDYFELSHLYREDTSLKRCTGLEYEYTSQMVKKTFEEFVCDDVDVKELLEGDALPPFNEIEIENFENDLEKEEEEMSNNRLKLIDGDELTITNTIPNWKHSIKEFEKKPLANFFDLPSFTKRLASYFSIKQDSLLHKNPYKNQLQERYRYLSFLLSNSHQSNWEHVCRLTYKMYKDLLYGYYEQRVILGEEKIIKRRERREVSKLIKMDSATALQKRRKHQNKKEEKLDVSPLPKKSEQEEGKALLEISKTTSQTIEQKNTQKKVQVEETSSVEEKGEKAKPRKYSKTSIQFSEGEKNTITIPMKIEKKPETTKFSTLRMQTLAIEDDASNNTTEVEAESVSSHEVAEKLRIPLKSDTLQRFGTIAPKTEVVKSSTLEIKSKFADDKMNKKDTLSSQSASPTAANSQAETFFRTLNPKMPGNNESIPDSRSNLASTAQNFHKGSPLKSDVSKSSATQREIKGELKVESIKSLDNPKKMEHNPDPQPTNARSKYKAIMSQASHKMDKSSSLLRNHMIAQSKRMKMNPSQLLFDSIYENRVLELQELLNLYPKEWIDIKDQEGNSMLMVAAKCGHEKAVSLLLNKKIDINSQNNQGDTAIHLALSYGHHHIADILINNGAKQNIRNYKGKLAWDVAL